MDAYMLIPGGDAKVRTIEQRLNQKYFGRKDFGLLPCDGVYSRQVQQGMMYAIQYEIGLADGVANANFGGMTADGIRNQAGFGLNAQDSTKQFVHLFQAALVFNGFDTDFDGFFSAAASAQTSAFQEFVALPQTGAADFATWASLLVSTGDVTRPASAMDTNVKLDASIAAAVYAQSYRTVGRYINGAEKRIGQTELTTLAQAGLSWFPIWQEWNNDPTYFSAALGEEQGQRIAMRMRQLGVKSGNRVYLSVDYDATDDEVDTLIVPHFEAVAAALADSKSVTYRLGVYSTRNVCTQLADLGLTESSFVSDMSTGYSGNLGFRMPTNWAYDQIVNLEPHESGLPIEIDRVVTSPRAERLTADSVHRTPSAFVNGVRQGFDEAFYWRITGLTYLIDACSDDSPWFDQYARNDLVIEHLQKPDFWLMPSSPGLEGLAWSTAVTPPVETKRVYAPAGRDAVAVARTKFEAYAGNEMYPMPSDGLFGDTTHWAACTRGYLQWGTPTGAQTGNGDWSCWALDLVQSWNGYEEARLGTASKSLSVFQWYRENIGVNAYGFGLEDFKADMAAYIAAKRLAADPAPPLHEVLRQMLIAIEDAPGWLAQQFYAERFGSDAAVVGAARAVFTAPPPHWFARQHFLKPGVREPGTAGNGPYPPTAAQLAVEIDEIGQGFAEAIKTAMNWTSL